jgi:hypothetical protein
MTAPFLALADTTTMLRRDVRHAVRFPMVTISGLLVPVLFLLLFEEYGRLPSISRSPRSLTPFAACLPEPRWAVTALWP